SFYNRVPVFAANSEIPLELQLSRRMGPGRNSYALIQSRDPRELHPDTGQDPCHGIFLRQRTDSCTKPVCSLTGRILEIFEQFAALQAFQEIHIAVSDDICIFVN